MLGCGTTAILVYKTGPVYLSINNNRERVVTSLITVVEETPVGLCFSVHPYNSNERQ